jgi:hypothetical protein
MKSFTSERTLRIKHRVLLATVTLVAVVMLLAFSVRTASSATNNGIVLGVVPSSIMDYSMVPGNQFEVNVSMLYAVNLHGFSIGLSYDPSVITCLGADEGTLLRNSSTTVFTSTIDNTSGDVSVSVNLTAPAAVASGNGTLFGLTFNVNGVGESRIQLVEVNLYDPGGSPLQYVSYDGNFNNKFLFDVTMPLALFGVTLVSLLLNGKTESKLKNVVEDREFQVKDAVLLVVLMAGMISLIFFLRETVAPLTVLFLFSYSSLLFIFTYVISNKRWYIAILPPIAFLIPYVFLRDTTVWSLYLVNIYGIVFAILITLYLASMFSWKSTLIFVSLLTIADIILVLATKIMIQAAQTTRGLGLPVLVALPVLPLLVTADGIQLMALGLGDFFFAGLLSIQTFKKWGRKTAIVSMIGMAISFFLFETALLSFWRIPFPGTVMIIVGWAPVALWSFLRNRTKATPKTDAVHPDFAPEQKSPERKSDDSE